MNHNFQPVAERANGASSLRWAALAEAAGAVALLAGVQPGKLPSHIRNFPALIRDASPWRRTMADEAIADLAAVMEPGLAALLAISARGADPRPAATALWRDYLAAREAIVALLPPEGALGPRRLA